MRSILTSGLICLDDDYRFTYRIANIEYEEWENGRFEYRFYPFYPVIDMMPPSLFQGIPGLDLSLRRSCYLRQNIVPVFISERTPGENREDLYELLDEVGMNTLNRLEWLIRTDKVYVGDRLYVTRPKKITEIETPSMYDLVNRSDLLIGKLLRIICFGDCLYTEETNITDANRADYYRLLMPIYIDSFIRRKRTRIEGIREARKRGAYKGRAVIALDPLKFKEISEAYLNRELTAAAAADKLGISTSTFFRRLRAKRTDNSR